MDTCTSLTTFHHTCGHEITQDTHNPDCTLASPTVAPRLPQQTTPECIRRERTRIDYSECATCASGQVTGLPMLPERRSRLRTAFQARTEEQNAADERAQVVELQRTSWFPAREQELQDDIENGVWPGRRTHILGEERSSSALLERVTGTGADCVFCLEALQPSGDVRQLECGLSFHRDCIRTWFEEGKKTCPLGRAEFKVCVVPSFEAPVAPLEWLVEQNARSIEANRVAFASFANAFGNE